MLKSEADTVKKKTKNNAKPVPYEMNHITSLFNMLILR